ncbi:Protein bud22 [Psilocybe cubensis]|uniref:Bud22 domain-containing protein n=2 Tax=Psilocybe cubensis TaxID=181762 RepID=A0A8H7Y450_PSICU|nr:Protein bud22 [Psilocybe cubensis]KAH9480302.1 Protein bud22 [Psilocybe cubensis]
MDTSSNPQLKRKRYEPPEEHHEVKEVHKASKRAKIFETQKVIKRLKGLRKKDESNKAIADFEAELTSLKEVHHDAIGNSALRSKVLKDHALRDNEDVKAAMTKELESNLITPATPGTTLAKIQSRLLSSKILAQQITATITSLKYLLDPALKQRVKGGDSEGLPSTTVDPDSERPSKIRKESSASDAVKTKVKAEKVKAAAVDSDREEFSDSEEVDEAGWESGTVDGDGGGGRGDDDGWESGSIDGGDGAAVNNDSSDEDDSSEEGSESESESDDELTVKKLDSKPKAPTAKSAKSATSTTKMESTFLPSLSVGFVRGSDDSDFSEGEDKSGGAPKKNRRGQRARRLIWEKKFGKNANHKKKEMEASAMAAATAPRNKGHTSKVNTGSNAIASRQFNDAGSKNAPPRSKGTQQHHQPADAGWGGRTNRASVPAPSKSNPSVSKPVHKKDGDKPLHPSWEAKRRLKEKESAGIVASQGTKIKFT